MNDIDRIKTIFENILDKYLQWPDEYRRFLFPYRRVKYQAAVIIYGAGFAGNMLKWQLDKTNYANLAGWVDQRHHYLGEEIDAPESILDKEYDYVVIAIERMSAALEAKRYLTELGIPENKILVGLDRVLAETAENKTKLYSYLSEHKGKIALCGDILTNSIFIKTVFNEGVFSVDYIISTGETYGSESIMGIPIKQLSELDCMDEDDICVIAASSEKQQEIELRLLEKHLTNRIILGEAFLNEMSQGNIDISLEANANILKLQAEFYDFKKVVESRSELLIRANEIAAIHCASFGKYQNCHMNKDLVIVATGPTLKYYKPADSAIHIGVNRASDFMKLDYLFFQDFDKMHTNETWYKSYENADCVKFCGIFLKQVVWKNHQAAEGRILKMNANRYFLDAAPTGYIYRDIRFHPLMDFFSITFPALHFALFTNPRKIYLVGCDTSKGKSYNGINSYIGNDIEHIMAGYYKVKQFAGQNYPDTEIISINPVGLKGIFKDIYTEDYLKDYPEIQEME